MKTLLLTILFAIFFAVLAVDAGAIRARASKNQGAAAAAAAAAANNGAANAQSVQGGNADLQALAEATAKASDRRDRPCDNGDISLAFGLGALLPISVGEQAAVVTVQGLLGGDASDIQTAITRLQQFVSTAALQIQMAVGIADSDSFAQPQLALLGQLQSTQQQAVSSLTGVASDNTTLNALLDSFQATTDVSQDGADNALIDCFIPLTVVSG